MFGAFPFFSYREEFGENGRLHGEHLVIPALLTYHQWWPTGAFTLVGPFVYFRQHSDTNWALVPFVFHHSTPQRSWTLIPPLLSYRSHSYEDDDTFTLVGPFFAETAPQLSSYNLAPVFFYRHDHDRTRVTIVPLFHTETGPNHFVLITALGGVARDGAESTVVTWLYQNHRGQTNVDAIAPLFFYSRTPRLGAMTLAVLPIGFFSRSPTSATPGASFRSTRDSTTTVASTQSPRCSTCDRMTRRPIRRCGGSFRPFTRRPIPTRTYSTSTHCTLVPAAARGTIRCSHRSTST